jgi:hypothetical protein
MRLFCSDDFGKNGSGHSVLDCDNRKWLSKEFSIEFWTIAKFAQNVAE